MADKKARKVERKQSAKADPKKDDKRLRMLKSVWGERKGQERYDQGFTN
jgi:hypothetical protein